MNQFRVPERVLRATLKEEEEKEVMLNTETGVYHLLNGTGREVLAGLETGRSIEETADSIADEKSVPREQVRADLESFVRALVERGLIEEAV